MVASIFMGLAFGSRRIPVDLHLALHQQLVVAGIVGGAGGLAVALFEDEAGRLVGIDAARVAVAGEAGGFDDGGLFGGLALDRQVEGDLDIALGVEAFVRRY